MFRLTNTHAHKSLGAGLHIELCLSRCEFVCVCVKFVGDFGGAAWCSFGFGKLDSASERAPFAKKHWDVALRETTFMSWRPSPRREARFSSKPSHAGVRPGQSLHRRSSAAYLGELLGSFAKWEDNSGPPTGRRTRTSTSTKEAGLGPRSFFSKRQRRRGSATAQDQTKAATGRSHHQQAVSCVCE